MIRRFLFAALIVVTAVANAFGEFINTNDLNVYNSFATGATVQNFESVSGLTPLDLNAYTNAYGGTAVPSSAQLGGQITGLHFHSGGASFNDPTGNPGTPAALLGLTSPINGDPHSASHVVGPLEINTENLHLGQFVEVIFTDSLMDRAGLWLNPALGPVLFTAFDATGSALESGTGDAGNFVAVKRNSDEIKFLSIVSTSQNGFTLDDLTYGIAAPEPSGLVLGGCAAVGLFLWRRLGRARKG